jgi:alkylation response protein AidB-like acyl-CoA dehydrogenase
VAHPEQEGLGRLALAEGIWRHGLDLGAALHLQRRAADASGTGAARLRRQHGRPVIYTFGNEKQKKQYLPRIASVDDWWCQGFSEPGSGSDLASLKTKAERKGDKYIINGQKTWTTLAQHADMIFCLCRTDNNAKKQMGISFIVFDMKSKGVTGAPDRDHRRRP